MMRFTMILLCLVLAAAAAGRYQAEAAVRETRNDLRRLEQTKEKELSSIQLLRAEIAYLESPDRLAEIAESMTDLDPLSGSQLMTAEDFAVAFAKEAAKDPAAASGEIAIEVAALADYSAN